ncbi:hypothetical protein ES703_42830 [subsurface metagenome]
MTTKTTQQPPALFLPEFLGQSAFDLGASALFFDKIGFDVPMFLQPEVLEHFNEIGTATSKTKSFTETAFAMAAELFRSAQEDAQKTQDLLRPLFEAKLFLGVLTVHFIMRSGREWLQSQTKEIFPPLASQLEDPAMLYIAAREFVWHMHETHLELEGDVQQVVQYVEKDARRYQNPLQFLASFICHRLSALEGNPGPVLTNNPPMINALAAIGKTTMSETLQDQSNINKEYLAFTVFDLVVRQFVPRLDGKTPERLVRLRMNRDSELNALRKHVRDIATRLLEDSRGKEVNEIDIKDCVNSLQESIRDVVEINRRTLKQYFQTLLEDKPIWVGVAGLVATLAGGLSPIIPASFGVTALAAMGTGAVKARRQRNELLDASPIRFLYYLDRTIGKR